MPAVTVARLEPFGTLRLRIDGVPMRLGSLVQKKGAIVLAIVLALGARKRVNAFAPCYGQMRT